MAGKAVHGDSMSGPLKRLYNIWRGMWQRCVNPKATNYSDYGGRGISVTPEWTTYTSFKEWALAFGYQNDLSIERREVNGNYTPNNCYWATTTIQACNKRKRSGKACDFIGVAPNRKGWQAYVFYKGKRVHLGTHPTMEQAAQVRDTYITTNGLPHKLNF